MPGYAENVGLAAFFENLGKNVFAISQAEKLKQDEINKLAAERTARAIDSGRLMYQPQAPVSAPLSLTGDTTMSGGIGDFFAKQASPESVAPATPQIPKATPLSLTQQMARSNELKLAAQRPSQEQENEILSAVRQGKPIPGRYTTVQQELPAGTPSETTIDSEGKMTRKWNTLGEKKAADLANYKEQYLKYQKLAVGAKSNDNSFKALATLQKQAYQRIITSFSETERASAQADYETYTSMLEELAPIGPRQQAKPVKKDSLGLGI
jgi:hypothetical protein